MIAELKQVLIKSAKYNKDGDMSHDRYAAININVPITDDDDEDAIIALFDLLRDKQVSLHISKLKDDERKPGTQLGFKLEEEDDDQGQRTPSA